MGRHMYETSTMTAWAGIVSPVRQTGENALAGVLELVEQRTDDEVVVIKLGSCHQELEGEVCLCIGAEAKRFIHASRSWMFASIIICTFISLSSLDIYRDGTSHVKTRYTATHRELATEDCHIPGDESASHLARQSCLANLSLVSQVS
jgi:hypothetical protein